MKNGDHAIWLFQGVFEKNILTFKPGWDSNAQKLAFFTDVRVSREGLGRAVSVDYAAGRWATLGSFPPELTGQAGELTPVGRSKWAGYAIR